MANKKIVTFISISVIYYIERLDRMHSEYITLKCIKDQRDKLLLLKYSDVDITQISQLLHKITLSLMDQCYDHVRQFDNINSRSKKNKKYLQIQDLVLEKLKDMAYVKAKFIEYFSQPGKKTKEDLLTYVLGFPISVHYYNEYLYAVLIAALKKEFTIDLWNKYDLRRFETGTDFCQDFYILTDTKYECGTGSIDIDVNKGTSALDKYVNDISSIKSIKKLEIIKQAALTLDNYYNKDFPFLNNPYKDSTLDLIDHIKVYQDYEKPTQFIKRI